MYTKENSVVTNLSVSANLDNLTHLECKNATFLAVHDSEKISLTKIGSDGRSNKEFSFETTCEDNRNFIQRVKLVLLHEKPFLVAVSSKTLKVFSVEDDQQVIFTHNIQADHKLGQMVHSVVTLSKSMLAIGTQSKVYFFQVNNSGNNFKSKEIHQDFKSNSRSLIYNFTSNGQSQCAVAENIGLITVWKFEDNKNFTKLISIEVHPNTKCTSLQLYKRNVLVLATISGQIQLININNGQLQCEIQAHVRCITSFDIAAKLGYLVTTSEDSRLRVFRLVQNDDKYSVEHLHQMTVDNEMICGAKFLDSSGNQLAISTYESCNIKMFRLTHSS